MGRGYFCKLSVSFPTPKALTAFVGTKLGPRLASIEAAGVDLDSESAFETFPRGSSVKAFLGKLERGAKSGEQHLVVTKGKKDVAVEGYVDGFDAYQVHAVPFFLTAAGAGQAGGHGRALFWADGDAEGPTYEVLESKGDGVSHDRLDEPQDLTDARARAILSSHTLDCEAIATEHARWYATHREKKIVLERADRAGILVADGSFVVEPRQRETGAYVDGLVPVQDASYRWGYVDLEGKEVVPFEWFHAHTFAGGLGRVQPDHRCYGFVGRDGAVAISPTLAYAENFSEGRAVFGEKAGSGKPRGYVDTKGAVVVAPRYAYAGAFSGGRALVAEGDVTRSKAKWGFLGLDGEVAISLRYDYLGAFVEGLAPFHDGKAWGLLDPSGAVALSPRFTEAAFVQRDQIVGRLASGVGLFTRTGEVLIAPKNAWIKPAGDVWVVSPEIGEQWLFDRTGRRLAGPFTDVHGELASDRIAVQRVEDGPWGFVDGVGAEVVPPRFTVVSQFGRAEGSAAFGSADFGGGRALAALPKGAPVVLDTAGEIVAELALPSLESASGFLFRLAIVECRNRYGVVADDGRIVHPPVLADVRHLDHGRVYVKYPSV